MTRDEWNLAEPIVTEALLLPEPDRKALIDTAFLEEALRRELLEALHHTSGTVAPARVGTPRSPVAVAPPRLVALKPGDALDGGRFVVIRQIGRGGMGSVYLAHDTMLGTLVALKALPFDEHLLAEARRAAVCSDHPHVATVHNILRTEVDGEPVGLLVMEYVAGTPASRLLDDGPVDIGRALRWGRQIAAAIAHAHDHQVLHCDLKPANIVITPDGHAKVLDFGIARATFDVVNPAEPVRGTVPYMAPEQLMAGEFSQAGDIYSLGVTLFELIAGRRPFEGDDAKLRLQIMVAPPPPLSELVPGVSPQLQTVIERALAKEPEKRFRSARAFDRGLEEVETGVARSTTATVTVPVVPPAPPSVWSKIGIATACLAALVIGVTLVGALTSAVFNMTLERRAFAEEGVAEWFLWGRRAAFAPLFWLIVLAVLIVPVMVARAVLRTSSTWFRRVDAKSVDAIRSWAARLYLDNISVAASFALMVCGAALTAAAWYYFPLIDAMTDFVSRAPAESLALLSDSNLENRNDYRRDFTTVVIFGAVVWYPVLRRVWRGEDLHWGIWTAAGAMLVAALVLLHFPYRLMNYRNTFEVVRWSAQSCYVIGERAEDVLLFCPELAPSRNRIAKKTDPALMRTGETVTNLFDRFAAGAAASLEQAN